MGKIQENLQTETVFLEALNAYKAALQAYNINSDDAVIVGSGVLEPLSVRLTTDIDFTLKKQDRDIHFNSGITNFNGGVDLVTEGYHRFESGSIGDDEIIDNRGLHTRILGQKFVSPWIVKERKQTQSRPKDRLDVELIESYFSEIDSQRSFWRIDSDAETN